MRGLVLGATGVVFGDIGTSPLYTFQECIGPHGVDPTRANVVGVISLIVWAVTLVVTVKYLWFMMRADNRGEGGIFALLALVPEPVQRAARGNAPRISWIALVVVAGASLLFGDGIITPAISVLSAIEGIDVATPSFHAYVVPVTVAILVALFAIQRHGTGRVGRYFGPVMVAWFATIGVLGIVSVFRSPEILAALSPLEGARLLVRLPGRALPLLGAVVLAVTGGEALYADMGHFGARPIRIAWLSFIYPCLLACYLGQGALLLRDAHAAHAPFFALVPVGWATIALVALATPATVIASQALISGVFSLTHQAVRLGYFPRVAVKHTSSSTEGQIYVPVLNWFLAISCIAVVLLFRESNKLAAAFGLAVSGTMAITSVVYVAVVRRAWKRPLWLALLILVFFLSFDIPFLVANLLKLWQGGYLPLVVGTGFFFIMLVWKRGRAYLGEYFAKHSPPLREFFDALPTMHVARSTGAGVFLASSATGVPPLVYRCATRLHVLPEHVVLFTILTEHVPFVDKDKRVTTEELEHGFYRVVARLGFLETPEVPSLLREAIAQHSLPISLDSTVYFLGRETLLARNAGRMGAWSEGLFAFLSRNAYSAPTYFNVPPDKVVEIGAQIDL